MLPRRLRRLPEISPGVRLADTARARLCGLAGLREPPACALLLPRTRCVHTFGMRWALDLVWVDAGGAIVRVDRATPPRRIRSCRLAAAVVELPSAG
ncbi:MAG: DUF192 domain-containing protein [Solirubrobacteraceae bacterium]